MDMPENVPPAADVQKDAKAEAVVAMNAWLETIDKGDYAASWKAAAESFRNALGEAQWAAALNSARTPLGKVKKRRLASALYQTSVPQPGGKLLKGDFVIAQFESSYENLAYAIETITFEKEKDGAWRASGYYIRPKL